MHSRACVHARAIQRTCTHACAHGHTHTHTQIRTHAHAHTHTRTRTCSEHRSSIVYSVSQVMFAVLFFVSRIVIGTGFFFLLFVLFLLFVCSICHLSYTDLDVGV